MVETKDPRIIGVGPRREHLKNHEHAKLFQMLKGPYLKGQGT